MNNISTLDRIVAGLGILWLRVHIGKTQEAEEKLQGCECLSWNQKMEKD